MVSHHHHKIFIGITAIVVLVIGLFLGASLAANLEIVDLQMVTIALSFTTVILLLINGGLVLEVRDAVLKKQVKGKR
jgi:hypothetical protein